MKSSVLGNVEEKEDILCFTGHLDQRLYFEVRPKCGCVGVDGVWVGAAARVQAV